MASGAAAVPVRRRVIQAPAPEPQVMQGYYMPMPPMYAPPQPMARGPAQWPAAPEQPPQFAPMSAGHYLPAPEQAWNPGFAAAQVLPGKPSSPFSLAHLDDDSLAQKSGLESPVFRLAAASADPFELPQDASFTEVSQTPWQQPKKSSSVPLACAVLVVVLGACIWALKDDLLPPIIVEIPVPQPSLASAQPLGTAIPAPNPTELVPEIRRAEPAPKSVDLVAASAAAQSLFLSLVEAKNPEERAALIAAPEEHGTDVEELFAAGKLELISLKPSNATPQLLPSQEVVPLFQVVTKSNPDGALLRMVEKPGGGFLLDWPLFAETQLQKLAKFQKTDSNQPAWFHVTLRRNHGLDAPASQRATQVFFDLQGSANGVVKGLATAQKESAIGRYLNRVTEWGNVYVARLLLQQGAADGGAKVITILDCEGAAAGATN